MMLDNSYYVLTVMNGTSSPGCEPSLWSDGLPNLYLLLELSHSILDSPRIAFATVSAPTANSGVYITHWPLLTVHFRLPAAE
jgi:hypothetical protein